MSMGMNAYRPMAVEVLQPGKTVPFPLYVERNERLLLFLRKNTHVTAWQIHRWSREDLLDLYIRQGDLRHLWRYAADHLDRILTDPAIPSKQKATLFYHSSALTMERLFNDPRTETLADMKHAVRSMVKNMVHNRTVMEDLFRITEHDYYTYTHSINVGIFATALAMKYYGNNRNNTPAMERLSYGYFLHDIGKARVPREILNKPGRLTAEEWVAVKKHPEYGYDFLMRTGHLTDEAAYITLQHHEQFDGSGYPYGYKGKEIHPCARICAIADTFDALTTIRPYKKALSIFEALKLMQQEMMTDFDYELLQAFIRLLGPHE